MMMAEDTAAETDVIFVVVGVVIQLENQERADCDCADEGRLWLWEEGDSLFRELETFECQESSSGS